MAEAVPRIEGYEIDREIFSRPGAVYYQARQVSMDREVWIGFLQPGLGADVVESFAQVMRRVGSLNHTNLVRVIHAGEVGGRGFAVFEKPSGPPVAEEVDRNGAFNWPEALTAAKELLSATDAFHRLNIASGGISPASVFMSENGHASLLFSGTAEKAGGPYAAPERRKNAGRALDFKTDVYSLGGILYFLLTARPPSTDTGMPNPRDLAYVPEAAGVLIERMMAADPSERPQVSQCMGIFRELSSGNRPAIGVPESTRFLQARDPVREPARPSASPAWIYGLAVLAAAAVVVLLAVAVGLRSSPQTPAGGQPGTNTSGAADPKTPGAAASHLPDLGNYIDEPEADEPEPGSPAGAPGTGEDAGEGLASDENDSLRFPIEPAVTEPAGLQAEFDAAVAYAEAHPDDRDGVFAKFTSVSRRAQSKALTRRCVEAIKRYTGESYDSRVLRLRSDIVLARELASQGRMPEAVALLSAYDDASLEPREVVLRKNALDEITAPVRIEADRLQKAIEDAAARESEAEVQAAIASLAAIDLPDIEQRLQSARKRLETLREHLKAKNRRERLRALSLLDEEAALIRRDKRRLEALAAVEQELVSSVKRLEIDKAVAAVRNGIAGIEGMRDVLNVYLNLLTPLDERMDALVANLRTAGMERKRVTLHKGGAITLTGYVTSVSRSGLTLQLQEGPEMELHLYDVDAGDIFRYAGMDQGRTKDLMDQAAFRFFVGEHEQAQALLKELEAAGEHGLMAGTMKQRILHAHERELAAREIVLDARRAYYENKKDTLRQALEALKEYSDTEAYKKASGE